jgi:hypothetical protein
MTAGECIGHSLIMREENPDSGEGKGGEGTVSGSKDRFRFHVSGFKLKTGKAYPLFGSCLKPET